jgi:hypothetical protein
VSILLSLVTIRTETRILLLFTNALGAGAFGVPAPAYYSVTNDDGRGPSPIVRGAYLVPGNPNVVELALSEPIVKGALYTYTAEGVPATDLSVTPPGSSAELRWGLTEARQNVEPAVRDKERLLYGVDLLWNGTDYQESATGDLDRIEGTANVTKALNRGVESSELPWDPTYGAKAREFVDSPSTVAGTLKGSVSRQLLSDPRVKGIKVSYEIQDEKTFLYADPTLISGEDVERISITVPNS